tara:strand:+ start:225888 stop:226829 length:942 start_codon:yes stop_codon:yes gene_type:complete
MKTRSVVLALLLLIFPAIAQSWDSRLLQQPVLIDGLAINYPVFAIYRTPGTLLAVSAEGGIELVDAPPGAVAAGGVSAAGVVEKLVVPAQSGWHRYRLANKATGEELVLNVYAAVPYKKLDAGGYLDDYRVGQYPKERLRNLEIYDPPTGFVRITEADTAMPVSPNFTVGQFPSKQSGEYPKYLVLRSALLIKLESILRALNEAGHNISSFHVMSGYRTPFYNKAIGNVEYSRHVWGGAADIYVDESPRDGYMDDLNGDGLLNKEDAVWLADFIDGMSSVGKFATLGGVGIYGSNAAHGPFVHVDVRGYRARW